MFRKLRLRQKNGFLLKKKTCSGLCTGIYPLGYDKVILKMENSKCTSHFAKNFNSNKKRGQRHESWSKTKKEEAKELKINVAYR